MISIHLFKVLSLKQNCVYVAETNAVFPHPLHEMSGQAYFELYTPTRHFFFLKWSHMLGVQLFWLLLNNLTNQHACNREHLTIRMEWKQTL